MKLEPFAADELAADELAADELAVDELAADELAVERVLWFDERFLACFIQSFRRVISWLEPERLIAIPRSVAKKSSTRSTNDFGSISNNSRG